MQDNSRTEQSHGRSARLRASRAPRRISASGSRPRARARRAAPLGARTRAASSACRSRRSSRPMTGSPPKGAVAARRGSGFFVAGAARPLALRTADPPPEPAIDPSWINRHAMMGAADFLCPGAGWLPDSWVLDLGVQRALRLAARDDAGRRRQYDEPLGYAPLRRLFSVRLAERGGAGRSRPGDRHRLPARRRSTSSAASCSAPATRWSSTTPAISTSCRS